VAGFIGVMLFDQNIGPVTAARQQPWLRLPNGAELLRHSHRDDSDVDLDPDPRQFHLLPVRAPVDPAIGQGSRVDRQRIGRAAVLGDDVPLLAPTAFFLLIINITYSLFDTFGVIDTIVYGNPPPTR
jgi:sn-glycerol 3-phosphate transport system permease protein